LLAAQLGVKGSMQAAALLEKRLKRSFEAIVALMEAAAEMLRQMARSLKLKSVKTQSG